MHNCRAYILLIFSCLYTGWISGAQDELKLYDKSGNYFMSLPVSKSSENGEFHIRLGNESPLQNCHGESVSLWIFYNKYSWKELEKKDDRVWTTSLNEFTPLKVSGMSLLDKQESYEKFANSLELVFKVDNPENPSVTLHLYAAQKQKNKKKDVMLYASLKPVDFQPETFQQGKRGSSIQITAGIVLSQEKKDSLLYESSKKNISMYVESAAELLNNAMHSSSSEELKDFRKMLENLKIDFETEVDGISSSGKSRDVELNETIKQFKKICQEFDELEREKIKKENDETAASQQDENKPANPVWWLVGGLGGLTVLLTLFMTAFFKILQKIQTKKEAEAKAEAAKQMKEQMKEQKRLMEMANRGNTDRKKLKI